MKYDNPPSLLLDRFLNILELPKSPPDINVLSHITKSFLTQISFETISKLYYKKRYDLSTIPDLKMYLDGIEKYNFGGTCYSNNYYMNLLLKYLGYDAILCGADMDNPDVHIVNIVTIDNHEYLVDVGYGAPFFEPMPRYLDFDYSVTLGYDKYVLKPQDKNGNSRMEHNRNKKLIHGYIAKPIDRTIDYFNDVFTHSFSDEAHFMNNISLARFSSNDSVILHNLTLANIDNKNVTIVKLDSRDDLPEIIEKHFSIPAEISGVALTELKDQSTHWPGSP